MALGFRTLTTLTVVVLAVPGLGQAQIGAELSVPQHLEDGEEYTIPLVDLVEHGRILFQANWTLQEGGGRPALKGNLNPLADPTDPLLFPRNFNRVSAPDANSCFGCHNVPASGGGGDFVANVFVLAQRFDFATFDPNDPIPTKGTVNEQGNNALLQDIGNSRNSLGMFGSGYIEMLARQMTVDLQTIRDTIGPGMSAPLVTKGVSFGVLARRPNGEWDTRGVQGLPTPSVRGATNAFDPPNLIIRPFHQAGAVISLRQFTNNAFPHHHGISSTERAGVGNDDDQDGFADEMTRADVTAASVYQATLAVPGRVIPNNAEIEQAVLNGEQVFEAIGCTGCHIRALPLHDDGHVFVEPNPFNPPGNLRPGEADPLSVDLNSGELPLPRLQANDLNVTWVPAFTDLKLHDITTGPNDPNREPLNMHFPPSSPQFFAGNSRFLTRKLWGVANEPPFFHHGQYTTMRQAIEAHHGEAEASNLAWQSLSDYDRDSVIEFLKTLQILPAGTRHLVIDENGNAKRWPPVSVSRGRGGIRGR
jgi:hypothetical protein